MEIKNIEIASAALCTEGAIRKAIQRGLDTKSLDAVIGFVMALRFKQLGIGGADDLVAMQNNPPVYDRKTNGQTIDDLKKFGFIKKGSEIEAGSVILDTSESQEEEEY